MESNTTNGTTATAAENTHDQDADAARVRAALDEIIGPNSIQTHALQMQIAEFARQAATRADLIYEAARDMLEHFPRDRQETALEIVRDMVSGLAGDLWRAADIARTTPKLLGGFPPIFDGRLWEDSDIVPPPREPANEPGPQAVEA